MKKITIILCIMAMSTMVACGNNNSKKASNNEDSATESVKESKGSAPETLERTKWYFEDENNTFRLTVRADGGASLYYNITDNNGNQLDGGNIFGDVTYSNGKGNIKFEDDNKNSIDAAISVKGKEMKFTFKDKTMTLKQQSID